MFKNISTSTLSEHSHVKVMQRIWLAKFERLCARNEYLSHLNWFGTESPHLAIDTGTHQPTPGASAEKSTPHHHHQTRLEGITRLHYSYNVLHELHLFCLDASNPRNLYLGCVKSCMSGWRYYAGVRAFLHSSAPWKFDLLSLAHSHNLGRCTLESKHGTVSFHVNRRSLVPSQVGP